MIPGDLSHALGCVLRAAAADGELPAAAAGMSAAGTWRPAPSWAGGAPGSYATSLPFALAQLTGRGAAEQAGLLAARLRSAAGVSPAGVSAAGVSAAGVSAAGVSPAGVSPAGVSAAGVSAAGVSAAGVSAAGGGASSAGIGAVSVTGAGYLTVAVTDAALTGLAPRVVAAGPACAAGDALRGMRLTASRHPDLTAAASWEQAWRWVADEAVGRLAERAGAEITVKIQPKRAALPAPAATPDRSVAAATAFAGADRVRYTLARTAAGQAGPMGRQLSVSHDLQNPFYTVCYAHSDAASVLRWAADLGLRRGAPELLAPELLAHPRERELLGAISWLPERVAGAARRRQPHVFAGYLEYLAGAWLDCRESCPALPFGGRSAPRGEAGTAARLWLADAARTALAAGLDLLGVAPVQRL